MILKKKNEPRLKLINVSKRFGRKTIIHNLNLDIKGGEIFGLLGPNGAGKTTTIRMILGLIAITEGEILIHGDSIRHEFRKAIAHIGAVIENPKFYGFLSGYKNLIHFANLFPNVSAERIDESIDLSGLRDRIYDKVRTYSLGMRQRLGIAQAILNRPSILILDEPTNGLDPSGIKELREHLRLLSKNENTSVVVSSHLLSEMELLCDRVAFIKDGRLRGIHEVGLSCSARKEAIIIEVDKPEFAMDEIRRTFPEISVRKKHHQLEMKSDRETIPAITASLVHSGIKIYRILPQAQSLEGIFMEITNTNEVAQDHLL
jgi:ABC-2 type transport system ATP-binding protein